MTQTSNSQTSDIKLPSARDIYDALMGDIEPELVSVALPLLDQKYRGETPAKHAARMERYRQAFEKYDRAFEDWSANFHLAVSAYRHSAISIAEGLSKADDHSLLSSIESQFQA